MLMKLQKECQEITFVKCIYVSSLDLKELNSLSGRELGVVEGVWLHLKIGSAE
jgi:hypothetical protein